MERDVQARITGFWGRVAGGYEAHGGNVPARGTAAYDAWMRVIGELLPPAPADVLDLGTGTGFVATIAAGLGHRVTASDLAEPMLAEARRSSPAVRFVRGDAVAPAFAPIADLFRAAGFAPVTVRSLRPLYPEMPAASPFAIIGVVQRQ